ncbi:hypothetical protein ACJMK2_027686 [Sinanodonta woodiana]|uniref:Aldehyde dehydrogenase domain-containing protein n=1 Tax=Sinanodonta woodiana TaxID=1069815 RepID=A0ABD3X8J2_SINWO
MSASTQSRQVNSVAEIFKSLDYGPAPEADNVAKAWLDDHGKSFGHFIDGKWVKPEGRKTYETKNPATGEVLATTIQGVKEDVDMAVKSARRAYESWNKTPPHVRARHLYSVARHIQKHMRLVSVIETMDNGKPIRETRDADIPIVVRHFYHHAGWAQLMDTEMKEWKSLGVIGAIVPWNFPLMLLTWKICPALAMGNTVVLKPATYTRLSALLLAEICAEAGLPPGVFNVVTGSGEMGSCLASHPDVDKVAFTGSTQVGQTLRQLTAGTGKKLSLELGGKSPVVVFETADLDSTVEGLVDAIWFNQGQVCSAGSRLIVQESVHDKLVAKLKERLTHFRLGDSLDKTIDMGALVDESQRKTIEEYVEGARREGAQVYQAEIGIPSRGCYYPPTIITNVHTVSKVVVEEIFGPVLVVLPFRTAKEAITLANNTIYGLASSVWTENVSLALEVGLNIKAGTVWVNCHNIFDAAAGFGGYKQSGYGRDGGKEGLYEYVRPKWEERHRPNVVDFDVNKFGATLPQRPTIDNVDVAEIPDDRIKIPRIDRTYKIYYGGAQKRPDAPYARQVINPDGKVVGHVGEGNRKDIRNAETTLYGATVKINEPVGVIGIACTDSYPLLGFVSLFAPAVVRGNTVVIIPSEKYPLVALDLYQVFDTSDLPGGVVNIITGDRDHLTKYLAEHQDVQSMWYFGSAEGSKFVEYISAENLKRTWVNYGMDREWENPEQGQGEEFLYHSVQVKNIWIPMGDIFAN